MMRKHGVKMHHIKYRMKGVTWIITGDNLVTFYISQIV